MDEDLEPVQRIKIAKLDAARRQLSTAIELWFKDGDLVSIHTLAFAAYEIIHFVSKKRNRTRDLIFDTIIIKDEYRKDWKKLASKDANFFKHADHDPDGEIEFVVRSPEYFMMFACLGLELIGEKLNAIESTFMFWLYFNRPAYLTDEGRKRFVHGIQADILQTARSLSKRDFFEIVSNARRDAKGPPS